MASTSSKWLSRTLARAFRPFGRVEPEEATIAAVMMLSAFLLLSAYYLLKTVREPLILLQGGAEVKLYARAAQAVLMVGFVHLYGELARRVGRIKLLAIVFLFFISNLFVFALLARLEVRIGLAFFLWVGLFSYTVVAQFWALAADIYSEEQGKRLFPIIGGGSSIGAVAGARLAKALVPYGPHVLMGAAVVILVVCATLVVWVERRTLEGGHRPHEPHPNETPLSDESAFHLVSRDRYLLLIGGMVVLLNWVNSSGEYLLDRVLVKAATDGSHPNATAFIGGFKADYFATYNAIGLFLQLFLVSRIIGKLGVRHALLFLPGFALFAYGTAAFLPTLGVLRWVKIGENSIQYSLADTSRNALFLVTSRVEKYVGKTSVDTIAVRIGAIMSSLVVLVGTRLNMPTSAFAALNAVLTAVWIVLVLAIGQENSRRARETPLEVAAEPGPDLRAAA